MLIYFGHSRMTYNTKMEEKAIEIIKKHYPDCEIVNPNTSTHQEGCRELLKEDSKPGDEMEYFLRLTNKADIGCFLSYYKNKWTAGSATELRHMMKDGKPVFQVDIENERLLKIEKVESFSFEETSRKLKKAGLVQFV